MDNKKVLLSIEDLEVKFRVRGRILTAIRGIDLDIYENESIAIVGESGSGKSVFTKTFAGMLDSNGFVSEGKIIFHDEELEDTTVHYNSIAKRLIATTLKKLNKNSKLELGAATFLKMKELKKERDAKFGLGDESDIEFQAKVKELNRQIIEFKNAKEVLDSKSEKEKINELSQQIKVTEAAIEKLTKEHEAEDKAIRAAAEADTEYNQKYEAEMAALKQKYAEEISGEISADTVKRNELLAKEIYLSVGRYSYTKRVKLINKLVKQLKEAMTIGVDLTDNDTLNGIFDEVAFRVRFLDETESKLHGVCTLNLAKIQYYKDWSQIRGKKIATVFQDPMTSLNPIITIGKQITSIIMKHQGVSESEARLKALEMMKKVGIPNAEKRFDDYPFQYSGGMRQRIVIAIALSCQPKILICDEPTTALDVTIQAQILKLLKDLQKEFNFTIVFITHDLGVVANIADRVAVLYAGQVIELANVEELFEDPRHPYTWALLSSLPQLAERNTKLYSITGTPPSLYNSITGDAFAPRNPYCMKIDTIAEPPMFKVSDTHYAKTWLLEPNAPHVEKPEIIHNIHEKLIRAFNI